MFGLTPAHLVIILVIALVVVGPGKLPEVGGAIGKSIREFQKAAGQITEPTQAAQPTEAGQPMTPMPPTQSYYAAQPGYPAPVYQSQPGCPPQPGYPAPVLGQTMSYEPVMGVVEPMPVQPAPTSYPPQNGSSS